MYIYQSQSPNPSHPPPINLKNCSTYTFLSIAILLVKPALPKEEGHYSIYVLPIMLPLAKGAGSWPNISCPPEQRSSLFASHSWNCTHRAAGKYDILTPSTAHIVNVFASHPGWRIAAYKSWAKSDLSVKSWGGNQDRGKQETRMLDETPPSLTRVSQPLNQERAVKAIKLWNRICGQTPRFGTSYLNDLCVCVCVCVCVCN